MPPIAPLRESTGGLTGRVAPPCDLGPSCLVGECSILLRRHARPWANFNSGRAQAEVASQILENALLEGQYAPRGDAKEGQSLLPERTPMQNGLPAYPPVRSDALYGAQLS